MSVLWVYKLLFFQLSTTLPLSTVNCLADNYFENVDISKSKFELPSKS